MPIRISGIPLSVDLLKKPAYLARKLAGAVRGFRADVAVIEGLEKKSGLPLTAVYFGNNLERNYLASLIFSEFRVAQEQKAVPARQWLGIIEHPPAGSDLVIGEVPRLLCNRLAKRGHLLFPSWVAQVIELDPSWEAVFGNFRKHLRRDVRRKVRRNGFTYDVSRRRDDFDHFYDSLHVPHIRKRFGEVALVVSRKVLLKEFLKGELLHLRKDGRVVAAALTVDETGAGRMRFTKMGLAEDLDAMTYRDATLGLYYFMLKDAHRRGCRLIHMGTSRPLLNDGVFWFKRQWGAVVRAHFSEGRNLLKPVRLTPAVISFFLENRFICRDGDRLSAIILTGTARASADDLDRLYQNCEIDGVDLYRFCSLGGFDESALRWAAEHDHDTVLLDLAGHPRPEDAFFRAGRVTEAAAD